jgi:regulator of protease activity HflC (stomatin/prohibitin superfamily)
MTSLRFNPPAILLATLLLLAGVAVALVLPNPVGYVLGGGLLLSGVMAPFSLLIAYQWERAVVLRVGRLHSIRGPGLFCVIPVIDSVATWMDQRIQTTQFNAERALTSDSVPTNIDAVLFWQVHDVERAALEISDYREAILRVAQTSLREMIGASTLSSLLADRKRSDARLREEIGRKIAEWGVSIISVEIRDVAIPQGLQDAMSRQAQAERERAARVTLGAAEAEIAHKFLEAANVYARNPAALQLRAMNIIYETTKERGATILIPTTMVDSMNPGGLLALASAGTAIANREADVTTA